MPDRVGRDRRRRTGQPDLGDDEFVHRRLSQPAAGEVDVKVTLVLGPPLITMSLSGPAAMIILSVLSPES